MFLFSQQTSLFLSSLPVTANETIIRTATVSSLPSLGAAAVRSVVHVAKSRCAFVNFADRAAAETAAQVWAGGFEVEGQRVNVKWGRSRPAKGKTAGPSTEVNTPEPATVVAS